ncbi:MAG: hypothetical protein K2P81_01715 [Bacteriovoracaceae bacterium]|nr:hypothetical protein [Bacteriovoracaceae bacterium]
MHHLKRFFFYSFFFAFFAAVSVWTYPHQANRGIASVEQHYAPAHFHYDASYKL